MREKEKTTVPVPSVGADGEQSLSYVSNEIIATETEEINLWKKIWRKFFVRCREWQSLLICRP